MANKYLNKAGLQYFYNQLKTKGLGLTEAQVNTLITNALNSYKQSIVTIVSVLPTSGTEGFIYLVPNDGSSTVFTTYFWEDNAWRSGGSVSIDLSNYYTKSEIDTTLSGYLKTTDMEAITNSEIDGIMQ